MGTSEASPPKHPSHQATEVIPRRHPPPGATEVVHPKRCLPSTRRFRKPGYTCLPCTYAWCWNGWATGPVPIIVHIYSALIYAHFITHVHVVGTVGPQVLFLARCSLHCHSPLCLLYVHVTGTIKPWVLFSKL